MDFKIVLLHAPSASGKTTFLQQGKPVPFIVSRRPGGQNLGEIGYRHGNFLLVDGDDLIHFTIGWPQDKEWWKKQGATYVHFSNYAAIVNSATRLQAPKWMTHLVVMFNGGMKQRDIVEEFYSSQDDSSHRIMHRYVVPSREVHERNIESRRLENLKEGRSWTFPRDWSDAQNNRNAVVRMAERDNSRHLFLNFEDALDSI